MTRRSARCAAGLAALALLPACTPSKGIGEGENMEATKAALATLAAPLEISGFQVVNADGARSVFFKLSRLPDSVASYSESDPARIVLEVKGPTGQEAPEQFYPGNDPYVTYVRITVSYGLVRVVMDLNSANAPPYQVQPMADWIMVRLGTAKAAADGSADSTVAALVETLP